MIQEKVTRRQLFLNDTCGTNNRNIITKRKTEFISSPPFEINLFNLQQLKQRLFRTIYMVLILSFCVCPQLSDFLENEQNITHFFQVNIVKSMNFSLYKLSLARFKGTARQFKGTKLRETAKLYPEWDLRSREKNC